MIIFVKYIIILKVNIYEFLLLLFRQIFYIFFELSMFLHQHFIFFVLSIFFLEEQRKKNNININIKILNYKNIKNFIIINININIILYAQ